MPGVRITGRDTVKQQRITIILPEDLADELRRYAREKQIAVSPLVANWIKSRLAESAKRADTLAKKRAETLAREPTEPAD